MAGLFIDSCAHYATADRTTKWTQATGGSIHATNGRRGGPCIALGAGEDMRATLTVPAPSGATAIFGFAYRHTVSFSLSSSSTTENTADTVMSIRQGGSTQVWVKVNADATISVMRGTTILGTTVNALSQNVYAYLELKVLIDPTVGTIDLHVNNASWLSLTGQNTRSTGSSTWNEIKIGTATAGIAHYCDMYACDGSGSVNDTFRGDSRADYIAPDAAGNSSQFTRSTGSDQWATVDDAAPDGDSTYNETSTATNRDTLNFPNMPVVADPYFIQIIASVRKTDAGACGVKLVTRISSTDYDGTEQAPGVPYSYIRQVQDVKPSNSVAWAYADVNAAQFGYVKST